MMKNLLKIFDDMYESLNIFDNELSYDEVMEEFEKLIKKNKKMYEDLKDK